MPTSSPPSQRTKICGRCNEPFACRAGDCWCITKWVPLAVLEAISRNYTDCLCARCLEEIVLEHDAPVAPAARPIGVELR